MTVLVKSLPFGLKNWAARQYDRTATGRPHTGVISKSRGQTKRRSQLTKALIFWRVLEYSLQAWKISPMQQAIRLGTEARRWRSSSVETSINSCLMGKIS